METELKKTTGPKGRRGNLLQGGPYEKNFSRGLEDPVHH
jgi:hypothetical protein